MFGPMDVNIYGKFYGKSFCYSFETLFINFFYGFIQCKYLNTLGIFRAYSGMPLR